MKTPGTFGMEEDHFSVMANLNFQQSSRSLASQSISRTSFAGSSLSGHVTPTSGMFPTSLASSFQPQQLSPNRNLPPMGTRTLFSHGQRAFPDRRSMPGLGGTNAMSVRGFEIPRYGSQNSINNFHSVFGGGGDTSTPPLLDLSEFPSLTNRGQGDSMPQPTPLAGKQPYGDGAAVGSLSEDTKEGKNSLFRAFWTSGRNVVTSALFSNPVGMVKQPTAEASEFTMSSEDFPALPGTQNQDGGAVGLGVQLGGSPGVGAADKGLPGPGAAADLASESANRGQGSEKNHNSKRGIQTSSDGKVTSIPASMVKDQFGMVGLLTFIRAAETDPNLVSLALGQDLTALGLNLNSPETLYPTFGGPWAEMACRPQDIDFPVPPEYLINSAIREKLAPLKLNRYKDDLLFYMFYTNVGDVLQLAAAAELYNRDWRYHMEEKVWITRAPGMGPTEKTSTYERGTYYFFDAQSWRKVAKEFHLDYTKLEDRPHLPPTLHHNNIQAQTV